MAGAHPAGRSGFLAAPDDIPAWARALTALARRPDLRRQLGTRAHEMTLGRTPDGGRAYVGRVIECAWRLTGVYTAVVEGRLEPWRAQRIADLTHPPPNLISACT